MTIEAYIAKAFSDIGGVERVYLDKDGDMVDVLTVIDGDEDEALYHDIYRREADLMQTLPRVYFNFHVVARRGRPIEELIGRDTPSWQRTNPTPCHNATSI